MLEVTDLQVRYGSITALDGVSVRVLEGEIVAVIGPNGAGKSTMLWALTGVVKAASGSMTFEQTDLAQRKSEDIVGLGMSLVPENRHVFASLSVGENLRLGATVRRDRDGVREDLERLMEQFPVLREAHDVPAGRLSGGQQQQLVIARALLARPRLLLLDEPSLGLDPRNSALVFETLRRLRDAGTTILLIEQNAVQTLSLADRTYVFQSGHVALHGTREELLGRDDIVHMYLGSGSGR